MLMRAKATGYGAYLPEKILTNAEIAESLETSDDWISQRTGIKQRHVAAEGEMTSDLGVKAAGRALDAAGLSADDVDMIICATSTPDETFPATATRIQAALGCTRGAAFDIQAVCSGFVYALSVADSFIRAKQAQTILVIGGRDLFAHLGLARPLYLRAVRRRCRRSALSGWRRSWRCR